MKINGNLEFAALGFGEVKNAILERMSDTQRAAANHTNGRIVFDTVDKAYYVSIDSQWVSLATGGDAASQTDFEALTESLGAFITISGGFVAAEFAGYTNTTSPASLQDILGDFDTAITDALEFTDVGLTDLNDTTITLAAQGDFLMFNAGAWVDQTTAEVINTLGVNVGTEVQAWDAQLDALSALATTGIMVQTGANTYSTRSISSASNSITITNADGVAADPELTIDADLETIAGFTHVGGEVIYSNAGTWAFGAPGAVSGVQGYDASLASIAALDAPSGTMLYTTGAETFDTAPITAFALTMLDDADASAVRTTIDTMSTSESTSAFVNVTGDTMSGNLTMSSDAVITAPTPSGGFVGGTVVVNKAYVDSISSGLVWLQAIDDPDLVEIRSTATPPGAPVAGTSYIINNATPAGDWSAFAAGDLVYYGSDLAWHLIKNIAVGDRIGVAMEHGVDGTALGDLLGKEEHIIEFTDVTIGAMTFDETIPADSNAVFVKEPDSPHYSHSYVYSLALDEWAEFSGPSATPAGTGLYYTGNTLNVGLGAGIVELPSDEVGIDHDSEGLILSLDGSTTTPSTDTGAKLRMLLDGSTLSKSGTGLKVGLDSLTNAEINANADIALTKLASGASAQVIVANPSGVPSYVDMVGDVTISNTGTTTIGADKVLNSMLLNDAISLNADGDVGSIALGATLTFNGDETQGVDTSFAAGTIGITVADALADGATKGVAAFSTQFTATSGVISLNSNTSELGDVTADATVAGQVMVATGPGSYTPAQIQYVEAFTGAQSYTVNHNLGQQFCNVTVVDDSAFPEMIIPESVVFNSATQLTVTFNTSIACSVIVMGVAGLAAV